MSGWVKSTKRRNSHLHSFDQDLYCYYCARYYYDRTDPCPTPNNPYVFDRLRGRVKNLHKIDVNMDYNVAITVAKKIVQSKDPGMCVGMCGCNLTHVDQVCENGWPSRYTVLSKHLSMRGAVERCPVAVD